MKDTKKKVRNANVQYLRGIGILAIVMYHFPMFYKLTAVDYIQKYMRFGQANELFFVIAGYFIAKKCFQSKWDIRCSVKYIKSRILRFIAPLFVWGGTAAITGFVIGVFSKEQSATYFFSAIMFWENIYNYYNPNYFGYLWFIACEFQFMLMFSFLLPFLKKNQIMILLSIMLLLLTFYHPHIVTGLLFEFHGLIIGIMLWKLCAAYPLLDKFSKISPRNKQAIIMACITIGLVMSKVVRADISFTVSSVFFCIALMAALSTNDMLYGKCGKFIKLLGDASYSIYLCHIPIILLADYFLHDTEIYNNVPVYFVLVMFCIGTVGMFSKKYIESI